MCVVVVAVRLVNEATVCCTIFIRWWLVESDTEYFVSYSTSTANQTNPGHIGYIELVVRFVYRYLYNKLRRDTSVSERWVMCLCLRGRTMVTWKHF